VTVAPLFVQYDYTFRPDRAATKEEALRLAHGAGVACSDEFLLHPDPYPSRDAWCDARIAYTERWLAALSWPGRRCGRSRWRWAAAPVLAWRSAWCSR
jgi:hypothetical protein